VVVAGEGYQVGQQLAASDLARGHVLEYDGKVVGTLIPVPNAPGYGGAAGLAFLTRINRALLLGAGGAAAAALLIGVLLARALTQPLKALTRASHAIADGDLEQQVRVRSGDEIGELSAAFNRMSADLAQASHLRRQMTADIAHDLRTPLTMILAHSEALRDGVLPPTPETYTLIHDEALRLSRLVEDLRTLSLADAGELSLARRPTSPEALLAQAVAAQAVRAQQQQVQVEIESPAGLPAIQADPDRMVQVLGNLLDNALRYMPAGGQLDCQVALDGSSAERPVVFRIGDSGPGIAPQDLPHVFERFYRADKARQRDASGSGLGLAIARSIVEAHGGRIWVESELGQGAQFFVAMPRLAGSAR
jgi:signal transduction histidine kinase